ncbi:MAG: hypothetical protein EBR01_05000 [Proteobacteria bacterium]|nr:hypothetical protein [Pseudomonadota bacterium]NBY20037.1 hypothetical protein [bacterium]
MHYLFINLIALTFVANLSFAAGKPSRTVASSTLESISSEPLTDTYLQTGFVLPILPNNGETGFGISFGVLTQTDISPRLLVGGDFGLHFWGKISGTSNTTGLQLTPTAIYNFASSSKLAPYFGLSAGPYLEFGGLTGTEANFLLVFRPGVNWNVSKKMGINGEAKFGSYAGALIVMPLVNLNIYL